MTHPAIALHGPEETPHGVIGAAHEDPFSRYELCAVVDPSQTLDGIIEDHIPVFSSLDMALKTTPARRVVYADRIVTLQRPVPVT